MQFFNFFYYIYGLLDGHQKHIRRSCSIPLLLDGKRLLGLAKDL
jgi:hypothetical protein